MSVSWVAVASICALACGCDVRSRRIPNLLTLGAAAAAALFGLAVNGVAGIVTSLAGWAAGAALFFPLFALGGMGAGDVKLLAALGAWLGPTRVAWVAVYSALAGGVMALLISLVHGYTRQAIGNLRLLVGYWRLVGVKPLPDLTIERVRGPRVAYALPITAGTLVTLWLQ